MQSLVPGRDFRSSLNAESKKKKKIKRKKIKFAGVFVTASDILFGKKIACAIPVQVMKDQYQPK